MGQDRQVNTSDNLDELRRDIMYGRGWVFSSQEFLENFTNPKSRNIK